MDLSTITFLAGLVSCCIGIATFITGMNARAQKEGALEQKINQAIAGIEDIKEEMKSSNNNQNTLALLVRSHDEQIKTLFRTMDSNSKTQASQDKMITSVDSIGKSIVSLLERLEKERKC